MTQGWTPLLVVAGASSASFQMPPHQTLWFDGPISVRWWEKCFVIHGDW